MTAGAGKCKIRVYDPAAVDNWDRILDEGMPSVLRASNNAVVHGDREYAQGLGAALDAYSPGWPGMRPGQDEEQRT